MAEKQLDPWCSNSPHKMHEFQIIEVHSAARSIYVVWAICKFCLKKERV